MPKYRLLETFDSVRLWPLLKLEYDEIDSFRACVFVRDDSTSEGKEAFLTGMYVVAGRMTSCSDMLCPDSEERDIES